MTRFLDGPCRNAILHLQRSPVMLRVVVKFVDQKPSYDALDQLDDTVEPGEKVYLYKMVSNDGWVHFDGRDPKTGRRVGRTEPINSYSYFPDQPTQEVLKDNKQYHQWCDENEGRIRDGTKENSI